MDVPHDFAEAYAQYHPRWFESPQLYTPSPEYLSIAREVVPFGWNLIHKDIWCHVGPPAVIVPAQGWKIHISTSTSNSEELLRRALQVLVARQVTFKFAADSVMLGSLNSKSCARGSGGKFITAYPLDLTEFLGLGHELSRSLSGFRGPYILSDRRWPESLCVYYRYGGFRSATLLQSDGTRVPTILDPDGKQVADPRPPYWSAPWWADDPFQNEHAASAELDASSRNDGDAQQASLGLTLGDGRYSITSSLAFSNRGGVYRAIDTYSQAAVVIKEARPLVEVGLSRQESVELLRKEFRLLGVLRDSGAYVRPVELFSEWEHLFLVEEFVQGEHLGRWSIRNNPRYKTSSTPADISSYLLRLRRIWQQLAVAIELAHQENVELGDISLTNVMIREEDEAVVIIDLEAARQIPEDPFLGFHTPGFRGPFSGRAADYYALGAVMLGTVVLVNGMVELHPPALERFLDEAAVDLALPPSYKALVMWLMQDPEEAADRPSLVQQKLAELVFEQASGVARLCLESVEQPQTNDELRVELSAMRDEIIRFITSAADPRREDRLFPADATVFRTNPCSIAHGASGVLYALHRTTGRSQSTLVNWLLKQRMSDDALPPGLYAGQAGVSWVLCELGYSDIACRLMRMAGSHHLRLASHGIVDGAAGYGLACLKMWSLGLGQEYLDEVERVVRSLRQVAIEDDRGIFWPEQDGSVRVGYGHGAAGISLFLLQASIALGDASCSEVGRRALGFDLSHAVAVDGSLIGFPAVVHPSGERPSVLYPYWLTGSAGIGVALSRYASQFPDDSVLRDCVQLVATDLMRSFTVFPQLFRGLAGIANTLLDFWQETGEQRYLSRAWVAARGLLPFRIESDRGVVFAGEQTRRESTDFATGSAGIVLFLDRLLSISSAKRSNFNFVVDELLPARSGNQAP